MSEDRRKTNKHSTGTVPKVKYPKCSPYSLTNRDESSVTNNLATDWHRSDFTNFIRNPRRNIGNNYYSMEPRVDESSNTQPIQNGKPNGTVNGTLTPNTSSSTSRRNSGPVALKCDNVSKYPDKKQIEDKLDQIREYLRITKSLMNTMKTTDDQMCDHEDEQDSMLKMINDLRDSEAKLVEMLYDSNEPGDGSSNENQDFESGNEGSTSTSGQRKNDVDINLTESSIDVDLLREQQRNLLRLQQKAENKLRDARQIQDKLLLAAYDNDINNISNNKMKNYSEHDFDSAIKELEERAKRLNDKRPSNASNMQDKILAEVDSLHNDIMNIRSANDERTQLIEVLDNRDAELRSHQLELQNKLIELQNKKMQVDNLVSQLQDFAEDEVDEDVGGQVRNIVSIKDQLKKLKDMLEMVKTTENLVNTNNSQEVQAAAFEVCSAAENFLQKDFEKIRPPQLRQQNDNNVVLRYDNNTASTNDNRAKQVNKNTREQYGGAKHRSTLQAELEAKKRELEEFMGKHKAGTSNLNHDVGIDNKSEFSCTSNIVNDNVGWIPQIPHHNRPSSSFSSEDCQLGINEYMEITDNHLPSQNCASGNSTKHRTDNNPRVEYAVPFETERLRSLMRTPERNVRSSSVATSGYVRERPRSNSEQDSKLQVQKQLHLIKSLCESMLDQQNNTSNNPPANVHQLRNNLTPSPLYSEPRRFGSPNVHSMNTVNVVHPMPNELPWFGTASNTNSQSEMANYQGWLATNTLQTQSFMLNTLNQCCQMLWLQQRELVNLRHTVSLLQERVDGSGVSFENPPSHMPATPLQPVAVATLIDQQNRQINPTQYRPTNSQKINHVSAACSMPNLNHYNTPSSNLDPSTSSYSVANHHHSNVQQQNGRLLDPCLNNINHLNSTQAGEHNTNNSVLHGVNPANLNQSLPGQLWNGQALNNQVAPGNRANNYWDNFRSYSRQNLLSTKNSEGFQNIPASVERSNVSGTSDRTHPFTLMSFSKSNSEQDSASTSQENTPQRRIPIVRPSRRVENINTTSSIPPPDVLNVNHNIMKINEQDQREPQHLELQTPISLQQEADDLTLGFQMLLNAYNDNSSNHSNISEDQIFKECTPEQSRRRNEWNNEIFMDQIPKTKLFDELRENVYKEVASLISANEARPHFLIQLFRDLQMIGSDSLRFKILQSIQTVITHSLLNPVQPSNRPKPPESQQLTDHDSVPSAPSDCFSMQSTVWSKPPINNSGPRTTAPGHDNENIEIQNPLRDVVIPFLNDHESEIIQHHLLVNLKQMLLESDSFRELIKDSVFQKHFSNILDEVLEQYNGTKLSDVKMHLIQALNDLLKGEISFLQLLQETAPDNPEHFNGDHLFDLQNKHPEVENNMSHIQNGDLAEADQSRGEEEAEEEGAVGGFLEVPQETVNKTETKDNVEEVELPTIDFPSNIEGLDQVPTRLPTKIKSRSTTPSRDRSHSRQDPSDSF